MHKQCTGVVTRVQFRGGGEVLGEDADMPAFPEMRASRGSGHVLEGRLLRHMGQERKAFRRGRSLSGGFASGHR